MISLSHIERANLISSGAEALQIDRNPVSSDDIQRSEWLTIVAGLNTVQESAKAMLIAKHLRGLCDALEDGAKVTLDAVMHAYDCSELVATSAVRLCGWTTFNGELYSSATCVATLELEPTRIADLLDG